MPCIYIYTKRGALSFLSVTCHLDLIHLPINFIKIFLMVTLSIQEFLEKSSKGHTLETLFVCFVALRPKSTAMVMAGRSVDLTTLFPGQA